MSAEINNREYRQQVLKELISQLHDGKSVDEVKERFAEVFGNVSAEEIAQAEQALVANGLPISEIQRLCDVHAAVFKGSIEDIHRAPASSELPGHPGHTLKRENRAIEEVIDDIRTQIPLLPDEEAQGTIKNNLRKLTAIDSHYIKKENLFFPYMEQYGITAPPKVMWGVDDEIRALLKAILSKLDSEDLSVLTDEIEVFLDRAGEMIFKEENILLPMLLENLTQDEWKSIADESGDLGYCLIDNVPVWNPAENTEASSVQEELAQVQTAPGLITLPTGILRTEELSRMLDTLPIDITFVGKDDTVKYFSQSAERVFPRTKAIIGRKVSNCHPPASVHIVEKLVDDFKAGRKDHEDFWINMGEKYILIRYFAVRDEAGEYMGVLEVTQNIRPIQAIQGEKRLVADD